MGCAFAPEITAMLAQVSQKIDPLHCTMILPRSASAGTPRRPSWRRSSSTSAMACVRFSLASSFARRRVGIFGAEVRQGGTQLDLVVGLRINGLLATRAHQLPVLRPEGLQGIADIAFYSRKANIVPPSHHRPVQVSPIAIGLPLDECIRMYLSNSPGHSHIVDLGLLGHRPLCPLVAAPRWESCIPDPTSSASAPVRVRSCWTRWASARSRRTGKLQSTSNLPPNGPPSPAPALTVRGSNHRDA